MVKEPLLLCNLPITGGDHRFILSPKLIVVCEVQTALFRFWTLVADSISCHNYYSSNSNIQKCGLLPKLTVQNKYTLCWLNVVVGCWILLYVNHSRVIPCQNRIFILAFCICIFYCISLFSLESLYYCFLIEKEF